MERGAEIGSVVGTALFKVLAPSFRAAAKEKAADVLLA
jgi:hypothetical protein